MKTLDDTLFDLAQFLPASLISTESLSHIARAVRGLPAAVTPQIGFECPLGSGRAVADFGFLVDPRHGGHAILAGLVAECPLPAQLSGGSVWGRVSRLCREWSQPESPVANEMRELWLEFDVIEAPREPAVPSVFIGRALESDSGERRLRLHRVLSVLRDAALSPAVARSVNACLNAGSSDDVMYVGVMLARQTDALRLCIRGVRPNELPAFLSRIDWPGTRDEACRALLPYAQLADRVTVALDVGETLGPRLGMECRLEDGAPAARWKAFLDRLVADGLCLPSKRDAVLGWTGWSTCATEYPVPPGHVSRALWLHGLKSAAFLLPTVMHFKVSYQAGRGVEAKAYLGVVLRWSLQPDPAQSSSRVG